jgi:streptomycin 6-kinase
MIQIPDYFKVKAQRQFGEDGPQWIHDLPSMLSECINRWRLSELVVLDDLSINFLCYATSPYGDIVLKICGPHSERITEMVALDLYAGRYACRCMESNHKLGAMLLERIKPGHCLRSLTSQDEQLRIGTQMVKNLPIPVKADVQLPVYSDWIEHAIQTVLSRYNPSQVFQQLMDTAARLFAEIPHTARYLLHGDLHHDNILLSIDGSWKIIDPQGVIGPPVLECGRFIQNHVIGDDGIIDIAKIKTTMEYFASALDQPIRSVWIAFFVLHVLSFCWGFEMNYTTERLKRGEDQCVTLLEIEPE